MIYALRQLIKNPGFTIVALLTLALGIGVNTTAFTVLNRLLLQSLPFQNCDRLVQIWTTTAQNEWGSQAPGDYFDERDHNTVFAHVAAYTPGADASLAEPGQPAVRCGAMRITANFFATLGVEPRLGRVFTAEEEKRFEPVAVVTNQFWREHYGADPNVVGRTVRLEAKIYTITGVLPPSLDDPQLFSERPGFWILDPTAQNFDLRSNTWYRVAARLKPGVTLEQARAEMTSLGERMAHDHPDTNRGRGLKVTAYPNNSMGDTGPQLTWLVMALSAMVLLIACVNLANLQLVRTTRRMQEFGVRLALGCSSRQLMGMLLTESLVLSALGGALGLLVAKWCNAYIAQFFEVDMPLDLRVIGFTLLASLATGATFGTVPAWMAARAEVGAALKATTRGSTSDRSRHRLRQGLVIVELGLALVLLTGAGFFVTGISKLTHRNLGWNADNELVGLIELDHDNYGEERDPRSLAFSDRMVAALQALPGVETAEVGRDSPAWSFYSEPFRVEGQPAPEPGQETITGSGWAGPGFLKIYRIPLLSGRDFNERDRPDSPRVVIVNEALAKKFWPGETPLGKRIGNTDPGNPAWAEVVGVMADFTGAAEFFDPSAGAFKILRPWSQNNHRFVSFNIRTTGSPDVMKDSVRKTVSLLAPDIAVTVLSTVQEVLGNELSYFVFLRRLLLQISILGLLLAAIGIYGVVANLTSERTKEIGIRAALGAEPASLVWLFLRNGIQLAAIGTALGMMASFFLLHLLARMLPVVPGNNPWLVGGVASLLIAVAVIACWLPARRATKIDPIIALRAE